MGDRSVTARRAWIGLACVAALVAGIALAYWQWSRYESASGTLQNLGYVMQWPLFGVFPAFMAWRIYHLSRGDRQDTGEEAEAPAGPEPQPASGPSRMAYVAPTVDDTDGDPARARYNRLLADLAAEDEANRSTKERA